MDLFDTLPAAVQSATPPGFRVAPKDAAWTVGELQARGWALRLDCAACGRTRLWGAADLARRPPEATTADLARRLVCRTPGCRPGGGTLSVLRPRRARRRHLTDRDIARIKALAAQVSPTCQPPILEDLDAPIRVGACLPGQEEFLGAQVAIPWEGRVILGWPLGRKALDRRRKPRARAAPSAEPRPP